VRRGAQVRETTNLADRSVADDDLDDRTSARWSVDFLSSDAWSSCDERTPDVREETEQMTEVSSRPWSSFAWPGRKKAEVARLPPNVPSTRAMGWLRADGCNASGTYI